MLVAFACAVSAQFDFSGDFGGPSAFAALEQQPRIGVRDPRTDRGPVQFPMSPPASFETSGVVIGASVTDSSLQAEDCPVGLRRVANLKS
ncbi:uncharacterized protein LOC113386900 [Ctenocephalides felis]|uniref:uncharacterized protein LOC113386900 n=1 Tax=Ctenocephalides felis TaxID=7515 RepID=UPI000E6E59EF|nr:uncharacterized protein LOC113386900 [Ctenocephalides felis]